MPEYQLHEVIAAWTAPMDRRKQEDPEGYRGDIHIMDTLLQLLSEGRPVTVASFARAARVPKTDVRQFFEMHRKRGGQFDEQGNLVGAALTLVPTRHQFVIDGRTLYTWCAIDAMFIPGLIGKTADVISQCPTTGASIQLRITPHGIERYNPEQTVLSITIPGVSCKTGADKDRTGPQSDTCSQIHFFSSRHAAEIWRGDRPGIAILTVEEAWNLTELQWIARRKT